MIKAVIFDMDGVLLDNFEAWKKFDGIFLEQFGIIPDKEYSIFVNGRSQEEVAIWLKQKYNLKESAEQIQTSKINYIKKVYEIESKPMEGIENLLKKIKKSGLKLALCSGAKMWMIDAVLDRFHWRDYFDVIVSSDHVNYIGKPNPEIYLHTARLLNVKPENCVVFEDAENGVEAAKRAGMKCIAVPNSRWSFGDFSRADLVVSSLEDEKILEFLDIE